KLQNVDAVTGETVTRDDMVKGYEVGKDQYVQVEDEELAEIAIESSHTVEIERFVPKASIDDRYRDTPYYLAPEDKVGQEAFAVIRDAMKKKKMVGIGRVVMARRERMMMLEPFEKGVMGTTLHYPYEIRSEESVFEEIPEMKLPDQMIGLAETIIDKMTGEFEPEKFEDRYENAMIKLIRSKQAGAPGAEGEARGAASQYGEPHGRAPTQHRGWRWRTAQGRKTWRETHRGGAGEKACEQEVIAALARPVLHRYLTRLPRQRGSPLCATNRR